MDDYRHYIVGENVERFETLLRSGRLDGEQIGVVRTLLAQARAELATLECVCRTEVSARVARRVQTTVEPNGSAGSPVLRPPAGSCAPSSIEQVHC
ncbi:MAG TPA: hypothetical protein VME47_05540 [Acetobacteraceae bacterium]|nr:hypothetical protein [Acetobacteraceae bacterium]